MAANKKAAAAREAARALVLSTDSRAEAYAEIRAAAAELATERRGLDRDGHLLLGAARIRGRCRSERAALIELARLATTSEAAALSLLRHLQRRLKGKSLAEFARRHPGIAQVRTVKNFEELYPKRKPGVYRIVGGTWRRVRQKLKP